MNHDQLSFKLYLFIFDNYQNIVGKMMEGALYVKIITDEQIEALRR